MAALLDPAEAASPEPRAPLLARHGLPRPVPAPLPAGSSCAPSSFVTPVGVKGTGCQLEAPTHTAEKGLIASPGQSWKPRSQQISRSRSLLGRRKTAPRQKSTKRSPWCGEDLFPVACGAACCGTAKTSALPGPAAVSSALSEVYFLGAGGEEERAAC